MQASHFSQVANRFGVQTSEAFSQKAWRNKVYVWDPGKLCAGLCHMWLQEKLRGRSLLTFLETQQPIHYFTDLLDEIHRYQQLSHYPLFPEEYQPTQRDLQKLVEKYGTDDWLSIQCKVDLDYQGDFVLYDLSRTYAYDKASVTQFISTPEFISWSSLPYGSLILGVLRYSRQGKQRSHRFCYFLDHQGNHHFFDPNAGEVVEANEARFFAWLNGFFAESEYFQKYEKSDNSFLTLYQLDDVSVKSDLGMDLFLNCGSEKTAAYR
ncbi:YopT-type cysteine protease domain-containing protein [Litoribrevibacter albus]|uniref:Peptidase C58 YopT-type domain-containing protein n=1 Tax=Litoribrevibacter albus TaxID=1473156 RepID=A0AA37S9B3_9GAMM|nr:YopT-type cysteine protease domain-containing protein [Litoribrevibacter albus]GLQ30864.1 hypothetical protein GCM10007876_13430 [Litoribrevibacter albus]